MSHSYPYDRSRPSPITDPYLAGFTPSTSGSAYVSPLSCRTTTAHPADSKSSADYAHALRRATESTGNSMHLEYGECGTEKAIAPKYPGYRSQGRGLDSSSPGMSYSQSRRSARNTPGSAPNTWDEYDDEWANENVSAATTTIKSCPNRPSTSSSAVFSRPCASVLQSSRSAFREPSRNALSSHTSASTTTGASYPASVSAGIAEPQYVSSSYPTHTTQTMKHRARPSSRTSTDFNNLNYKSQAQAQISTLNEAQQNGTPFEEYWAGLAQSVRSSHRRSSASRERSLERAASKATRDASRGGLGFQEWWDQESKKMDLLRGEEANMLNEREIERYRSSKCQRS